MKAWHALGSQGLLDIYDLHKAIDELQSFDCPARTQPTYGKLCRFFLAYSGQLKEGPSPGDKRKATKCFQADCFGRMMGQCVVLEVRGGVSQKVSRQSTNQDRKKHRHRAIRTLVEDNRPKVVLCYGKACWKEFECLFKDVGKPQRVPGMASKADYKAGWYKGVLVILSHHAVRSSNDYFEWLGRWAASQNK